MKAKKLEWMEATYLLLPSAGYAPALFLENLRDFKGMGTSVFPSLVTDYNILAHVEEGYFCIEILGPNLNSVNPSLYDFIIQFINANL